MDLQSFGQVVLLTAIIAGLIGFYIRPLFVWGKKIIRHTLIRPRYQKRIMIASRGKIEHMAEFSQKKETQNKTTEKPDTAL
ncbi:MAG: hypothetical protein ACRC53_00735 [Plesiomonas sp.]|uniref:hypothetical protein n=1 Tax=Plesiomonas sp. TaxID=2486279 RepID=UPI003F3724FA